MPSAPPPSSAPPARAGDTGSCAHEQCRAVALTHQEPPLAPIAAPVQMASYLLMGAGLLLAMWQGLLPGLLCACLGFMLTRTFAALLAHVTYVLTHPGMRLSLRPSTWPHVQPRRWMLVSMATCVGLAPLLLLSSALSHISLYVFDVPMQYKELLDYLSGTILELREKLPADLAAQLPAGAAEAQRVIASYLAAKAGVLASMGKVWLAGLIHAYVGLLIGALAAVRPRVQLRAPLSRSLQRRVMLLGDAFRQIVAAQFWIALFNCVCTAVFLLFVLPLWGITLPYTPALIALTFVAGLIPIVGNLFCNLVVTIVGLSVSPAAALACLSFLILIHKAEYFINARVVGQRTHIAVWELLSVMFVAESIYGPAGLVAAPLFYAYLKKELEARHLV